MPLVITGYVGGFGDLVDGWGSQMWVTGGFVFRDAITGLRADM